MEKRIEQTDAPDLRFVGEKIASASGRRDRKGNERNRFDILRLYRTAAGSYVCEREYVTFWQGELGNTEAAVCGTHAEVIEFFGHGELAKEIYDEADIDATEAVA